MVLLIRHVDQARGIDRQAPGTAIRTLSGATSGYWLRSLARVPTSPVKTTGPVGVGSGVGDAVTVKALAVGTGVGPALGEALAVPLGLAVPRGLAEAFLLTVSFPVPESVGLEQATKAPGGPGHQMRLARACSP